MNKFWKKASVILLMGLLMMPCVVVLASSTKEQLDDAKQKEKEMEQKLQNVKSTINSLKSNISDLETYIQELDNEMEKLAADIDLTNTNIEQKNIEIDETNVELDEAKATEKHQYESMKLRIQFMYEHNDETYMDMIFSSSSLADMLNKAEYVQNISEYDRGKLDEYVEAKQRVEDTLAKLQQEEQDLQDLKAEQQNNYDAVQLMVDAKNEEMEQLENSKASYEQQQKDYQASIAELDSLVEKLTAQYNAEQLAKANAVATQANLYAKKLLIWPLPSSTTITSGFDPARLDPVLGYVRAHTGTDIAASTGTPVVAAASGLVTAAGYNSSMGNYVIIAHGDGITTRYYHNSRLAVSAGQSVTAGQVISYVGSTGWVTGPHLHFEVRIDGTAVNAMQFY
jgi:murein DD-endopeptidase MepM/ murein hydrolase activator NlpD